MKTIFIHPDNRQAFLAAIPRSARQSAIAELSAGLSLSGTPIRFSEMVPARHMEHVWHPPEAERFVSYGLEDEIWMRPLGLGRIETIDRGPCAWLVDSGLLKSLLF